jgi:parallel beta-helix repeat protein
MLRLSVLICIALIVCLLPAESRTYMVDDNGFADFKTIGQAVVASNNGDTIYIKPGVYSESFTLNKSLKLMPLAGEKGDIVLNGDGKKEIGMTITSDDCSVEGLTISNFNGTGIEVQSNGNVIKNNNFEKNNPAILIAGSNKNVINNNIMIDCQGGVALKEGSSENTVTKNVVNGGIVSFFLDRADRNSIFSNTASGASLGIWLTNSTNAELVGNDIQGKTFGIWVTNSMNSNLTDNIVKKSADGIHLQDSSGMEIYNDSIKNIEYDGITLENSSNNVIKKCTLDNSTTAFAIGGGSGNDISDNSVFDAADTGVYVVSSRGNTLEGNTFSEGNNGIVIIDSSANKLEGNILKRIKWGLYVEGSTRAAFNNAISESNTIDGRPIAYFYGQSGGQIRGRDLAHLTLAYCNGFTVERNTIANDALFLFSSNNNRIIENNISGCYGMRLLDSKGNNLSDNSVQGNRYSGIYLIYSDNNDINGNTASENNQNGISILNSTGNIVRDNTVNHNYENGIWLNLSSGNRIFENNITNNPFGIQIANSFRNMIYHNNFIGNKEHAEDRGSDNLWDMGNITGGNYWSGYTARGNPSNGWSKLIRGGKKDNYPFQNINGWTLAKPASVPS